jgi:hypothetical protein
LNNSEIQTLYSTSAKIFPTSASAAPFSLGEKAFQTLLQEFTAGDFWPPFIKGGAGGFLTGLSKKIPPFPPFPKGGIFASFR